MNVCLLLADGFEEIEAIGTFAILSRAGLKVDLFAVSGQDTTGRFGLTCTRLKPFSQLLLPQISLSCHLLHMELINLLPLSLFQKFL